MSWFLRHGAIGEGYEMDSAGFVLVNHMLTHPKFKSYKLEQIKEVVDKNDKKRFELVSEGDSTSWKIRAV